VENLILPYATGVGFNSGELPSRRSGLRKAKKAMLLMSCARVNLWRCRNCGEWFSGTWRYNLGFLSRRCVHFGLLKYSNNRPSSSVVP
jgi:hypothetical protein